MGISANGKFTWIATLVLGGSIVNGGVILADMPSSAISDQQPSLLDEARQRGATLLNRGLVDGAIAAFSEAVRLAPEDPTSYCTRANALIHKPAYDEALLDIEEALRLDPELALAYCLRGFVHVRGNRIAEAKADFDTAITARPDFAYAYIQRGHLHALLGQPDEANRDLSIANRLLLERVMR